MCPLLGTQLTSQQTSLEMASNRQLNLPQPLVLALFQPVCSLLGVPLRRRSPLRPSLPQKNYSSLIGPFLW